MVRVMCGINCCLFLAWVENADGLSLSYSGTGALKTDYTRYGTRQLTCTDGLLTHCMIPVYDRVSLTGMGNEQPKVLWMISTIHCGGTSKTTIGMELGRTDSISSLGNTPVTQLHHTEFGATTTRFPAMPLGRSRPSLQPWCPRPSYSFGYSSSLTQLQSNPLLYISCSSPYVLLSLCPLGFLSNKTAWNS